MLLKTGSRPTKRATLITWPTESEGELAERRSLLTDLQARGGIRRSMVGHDAPAGWHDSCSLNAVTEPPVHLLQHIDALPDETRGAGWWSSKLASDDLRLTEFQIST